ncbi:hypothetical protein, partial [Klebsiella michiganensis]|uniref:hypothetical protein n=1 Tax=Klebsiella michiganensis TaxID=1134687 RepID=UPI001954577F
VLTAPFRFGGIWDFHIGKVLFPCDAPVADFTKSTTAGDNNMVFSFLSFKFTFTSGSRYA